MKYVHLSIDDVYEWLKQLHDRANEYSSMFEHPRFAELKALQERFGAAITLNCFYTDAHAAWNLGQMTTKYKAEFVRNAGWLRLAFHARCREDHYNRMSGTETARSHYNDLMEAFRSFASGANIDTLGRTHYFSGSLDIARAWRDSRPGATGFLTSDDDRSVVYYLDEEQRNRLQHEWAYYDVVENLHFVKSLPRLETWSDPVADLSRWSKEDAANAGKMRMLAFFTHEQSWNDQLHSRVIDISAWAVGHGYRFAFPVDIYKS
ncbi:hypothetical protein MO973_12885 [Paenibacillus sp. TRM 82003]|nr:hypothetical protein [Paenibacillus sp. TRM 82003]